MEMKNNLEALRKQANNVPGILIKTHETPFSGSI